MSVLIEFAIFPTDKGVSKSTEVSEVIKMIDGCGFPYKVTAMGTIIETSTLPEALDIVNKAYKVLEKDSERVYSSIKLDIRKNKNKRLEQKIKSIRDKVGNSLAGL